MNILQICNKSPYPPNDGGSLASYGMIRSFSRHGHDVTLLTMCTPKHGLSQQDKNALSAMVRLFTVEVDTTINKFRLLVNFIFSRMPYNAERFISLAFDTTLSRILQNASFDIVQLEGLYLMPYADTIRRHSRARIVLRAHNVEHEIWSRIAAQESSVIKKFYFKILSGRIMQFEVGYLNHYDLLVPITRRDLDIFNHLGNIKPAHVCPAALDAESLSEPEMPAGLPTLFFLGSLEWRPNQEGLLWFTDQVLPMLLPRHPGLRLHIAGRNAPVWLQKRMKKPGIVFHGEIPDSTVFIRNHDIMVAPCFSGSGMRVKIIEAMSHGKPVVTTPIGAEGLGAAHNENILISDSINEFAEFLDRLIKFPDFYRKIGHNATIFIQKNFDNMKVSAELIGFYLSHLP